MCYRGGESGQRALWLAGQKPWRTLQETEIVEQVDEQKLIGSVGGSEVNEVILFARGCHAEVDGFEIQSRVSYRWPDSWLWQKNTWDAQAQIKR